MLYNSLLPHSPVLHCEEGVVLHKAHVDHMFREGNAAQCLASFFEHLSKRSLHLEIIDQPKRIVSTSDTTTLSPASDTWESNLVLVIAVTVTDAREFLVKEEKGSAAGPASPEAGAYVSRLVPIPSNIYSDLTLCSVSGPPLGRRSRQVSGSKCAAVHAGRTVTRTALARRWHVNDVQTAIPAPRQLRILGQLANWSYWTSCT